MIYSQTRVDHRNFTTPSIFRALWRWLKWNLKRKLEWWGCQIVKHLVKYSAILLRLTSVTDRQTDSFATTSCSKKLRTLINYTFSLLYPVLILSYHQWLGTETDNEWHLTVPDMSKCDNCTNKTNKSSAVAEMGDHLAKIDMSRKLGGCCALFTGKGELGPHVNTIWPKPRPFSVLSGILIHPAVWPQ